ncbi:capsular polysaccharide synthesis protein [Shimia sp. MIT910701]|uniref:capsular polysaccharide synthesis protein n=1 Tax=Shimia sp. MIT910701 TaxID=3096987 RepID=UPI003999A935
MTCIPRRVWIYWESGWTDAPALSQKSLRSWRARNPNWAVQPLDFCQVNRLLGASWEEARLPPWITPTGRSNLVRLALLKRYGGVWVDATNFCVRPLDHWIDRNASKGFFAFSSPTNDRPLSTWFLASQPRNQLVRKWLDRCWDFWRHPVKDENRWVHRMFADLIEKDSAASFAWSQVETIPAKNPLHFGPNHKTLVRPVSSDIRECVQKKNCSGVQVDEPEARFPTGCNIELVKSRSH